MENIGETTIKRKVNNPGVGMSQTVSK